MAQLIVFKGTRSNSTVPRNSGAHLLFILCPVLGSKRVPGNAYRRDGEVAEESAPQM